MFSMKETKHLQCAEFKFDDATGSFDGVLSTYGEKDAVGDVCVRGCFDDTVKLKGNVRPLLWNHSHNDPIGTLTITGTKNNLAVTGSINMDVQRGREAMALLKRGDIRGMSIGYIAEDYKYDADGVRKLTKVDLWEGSLVTFPANAQAYAEAKSIGAKERSQIRAALAKFLKDRDEEDVDKILKALDKAFEDDDDPPEDEDDDKKSEDEEDKKELKAAVADLRDTLNRRE